MHLLALDENSTRVLLALIGVLPSTLAAILAYQIRRDTKTPSGDPIGHVVERTHELTSTNAALLTRLHGQRYDDKNTPIPPTKEP